jgi:hypothetical protein
MGDNCTDYCKQLQLHLWSSSIPNLPIDSLTRIISFCCRDPFVGWTDALLTHSDWGTDH